MVAGCGITDVVFDFCGVLIDRRVTDTLAGLYPDDVVTEYFAYDDRSGFHYYDDLLDRGMSIEEAVARCGRERGGHAADMLRAYHDRAALGLKHPMPGMLGLLRDLSQAGMRLWGLTNMAADTFHRMIARMPEIQGLLRGVIVSGEQRVAKPDPRAFCLVRERFGIDLAGTLLIDDSSINVEAARGAGMQGAVFIDEPRLRRTLRGLGLDIPEAALGEEEMGEMTLHMDHDGASRCATAQEVAGEISLVPDCGGQRGSWRAMRLGDLELPVSGDDFWAERCREYRGLQWNRIDWPFVREQLERVAGRLGTAGYRTPEITMKGETTRERTFLEQWFGYGDACCAAALKGGRMRVVSGQHRVSAVANRPLGRKDAELLGVAGTSFSAGGELPADTLLPVFVQE